MTWKEVTMCVCLCVFLYFATYRVANYSIYLQSEDIVEEVRTFELVLTPSEACLGDSDLVLRLGLEVGLGLRSGSGG